MSKSYKKFYYIKGQIIKNSEHRFNAKGKALRFCKEKNIDTSEIYELSSNSELTYLEELLERKERGEIDNIVSDYDFELANSFINFNKEEMPSLSIEVSFMFFDRQKNKTQFVKVVDSVYELDKHFIDLKTLFDCLNVNNNYLQVYYLDENERFKEWHINDIDIFIKENKEKHKRLLAQKRAIRDRQRYDRLLRLRSEGKITEKQSQELYRLEKVFGGSNG